LVLTRKRILLATAVLCAGASCLWWYGRPVYRHFKEKRALQQAKAFHASGDFRNAWLSARQTLQANPSNLGAFRIMADIAERSRLPQLLDLRRTLAQLEPTTENKLRLAATALRLQPAPFSVATQTLEELSGAATNIPAYHVVKAELALKLQKPAEAARHFQEALRLEPTNELHQLNLAVLHLQETNSESIKARETLERLSASRTVGPIALRWLITSHLGRHEFIDAEKLSGELLKNQQATQDDRLQHLGILQQANKPEFESFLASLKRTSEPKAADVYALANWMVGHGLGENAFDWLRHCPPKVQTEQPVPLAFVEYYVAKKDWAGLDDFLQAGKWGELEFLRLAFLSRVALEQKQGAAAETRWRSAVREAGERLGALMTLLGLAGNWERDRAKEELLWHIAQRFPRERWAAPQLGRSYLKTGNTLGLHKVSELVASHNSKDFQAQNNVAATALLLKLDLPKAHQLARENYLNHRDQPIIAATYGFSLYLLGRTNEALEAFEKLAPPELESPAVALYYGFILASSGQLTKADKFLHIAKVNTAAYLPEEQALLGQSLPQPAQ